MAIELPLLIDGALKCGNLHGAPDVKSPSPKVHRRHFWGNKGELEIYGGKTGRPIVLNAILNDSTWTNPSIVFNYLKTVLDPVIGLNGQIKVTFPDSTTAEFDHCTFERYEPIAQPGHQMAAPLKDVTAQLNQTPNTWWLEVNLFFQQLQTGISDSTFTAS